MELKQIWKFSWNSNGYRLEKIQFDISSYSKGEEIKLPHSFFLDEDFKCYVNDAVENKIYFNVDTELKEKTDILLKAKDLELSKLLNKNVYTRMLVVSDRVKQYSSVYLDMTVLGDIIDPDDFQQSLNPQSDVKFKSLTTEKIITDSLEVKDIFNISTMSGDLIEGNSSGLKLKVPVEHKKQLTLNEGIRSKKELIIELENGITLTFDGVSCVINKGEITEKSILKSLSYDKIPVFGIPVILSDDKSTLNFVDFLKLLPDIKGIYTEGIQLNNKDLITSKNIVIGSNEDYFEIKICEFSFLKIDKQKKSALLFNGLIRFDLENNKVYINNIEISTNMQQEIAKMKRDIEVLKQKIR